MDIFYLQFPGSHYFCRKYMSEQNDCKIYTKLYTMLFMNFLCMHLAFISFFFLFLKVHIEILRRYYTVPLIDHIVIFDRIHFA